MICNTNGIIYETEEQGELAIPVSLVKSNDRIKAIYRNADIIARELEKLPDNKKKQMLNFLELFFHRV